MTLVVANRLKDRVTFSSDSRLSFESSGYFDKGIKIFKVPFRLMGLPKSREEFDKYEFEYDYGIAVIGSSINAYTVKESIAELINNLQYLSNISDISIIGIGHLILKVYEDISKELGLTLREGGLSEILVGGYCIIEKRIRVLRFFPKIEPDKIEYGFQEILNEEGILFFGSGKTIAEKIYSEDSSLKPLQIIKKSINLGVDNSIGGTLQNGTFFKENFKINGVIDEIDSEDGKSKIEKHYLRGFELDQSNVTREYPYLYVTYGYTRV